MPHYLTTNIKLDDTTHKEKIYENENKFQQSRKNELLYGKLQHDTS